jgi:hypothetical protein
MVPLTDTVLHNDGLTIPRVDCRVYYGNTLQKEIKLFVFGGSATPCASPPLFRPSLFPIIILFVHHPANRDDRHLFALAMVSGFSAAWQFSQRERLFFCYGSNSSPNYLNVSTVPDLALVQRLRRGHQRRKVTSKRGSGKAG